MRDLVRVPAARRLPSRLTRVDPHLVFFESWRGRYSDNPRAIAEELHRRGLPFRQVWAVRDPAEAPEWATAVVPDSRAYLRALGQAGTLVVNNTLPGYFRKRRGTFHLQTWHGTPLKRIAFDVHNRDFRARNRRYLRGLQREVAGWDLLVSPNRHSTSVLRRAFRFDGCILESGYPRNDRLAADRAAATRERVRRELAIPDGARAILYAPTWRDSAGPSIGPDVERVAAALGGDVLLVRLHELAARELDGALSRNVRDVSDHHEVAELYLAADALITDYSSAMFDFAVTGKPMVFFTYDVDRYRSDLRGFYFDLEADAPGPLVRLVDELIGALVELDSVEREHAAAYARFRDRFCHLDDGAASARVVRQVFER